MRTLLVTVVAILCGLFSQGCGDPAPDAAPQQRADDEAFGASASPLGVTTPVPGSGSAASKNTHSAPIEVVPPSIIAEPASPLDLLALNEAEVWQRLISINAPITRQECGYLSEDEDQSFGEALAPLVERAEEKNLTCEPAPGGFRCQADVRRHSGGEGEEFAVFLQFNIDAEAVIDLASMQCQLAG